MSMDLSIEGPCTHEAVLVRYCRRCGRKLKSESSLKRGLGPTCARKEKKQKEFDRTTEGAE